ncbi:MAG: lipase [Pseudonocardia sp.]|nr:lipase [Pseudonocardia sp.]
MSVRRATVVLATTVACVLAAVGTGAVAHADESGPELSVPSADLENSLTCHGDLASGDRAPVLLVPGTTLAPDVNFDWNYGPAFDARDQAYCWVELPGNAMGDIGVAGEYVTNAIRTMHADAGRKIDVVGFSQGGMVPRWSLKFWPDTRDAVRDVVGIDPSNHGTLDAYPVCAPGCAPAFWQQQSGSRFLDALNDGGETFAGIDYTVVYTPTDEVVVPNLPPAPSSELRTGDGTISNISTQQICPVHVAEHLTMGSTDPVGYAVVVDALDHDGPADARRIARSVCAAPLMPGVDPVALPANEARYVGQVATTLATYPHVLAEPQLRGYAR